MKSLRNFLDERAICSHFELTKTEFKRAMTHNSSPNKHNGSRYVFLAQFGFRGLLAEWMHTHIGGTGTELQHFLGNVFSQKRLEELYDTWRLHRFIIFGEKCDPNKQKHIFALSFIGCVMQHSPPNVTEEFMMDFFILPNNHLMPKTHIVRDDWQKLLFLCKQHGYKKPETTYELTDEKKHRFSVALWNGTVVSCESVSYRYAKKKTIKKALLYVVEKHEKKLLQNPVHQQLKREALEKKEAAKAEELEIKQAEWEAKQEEKQREKALKLAKRKQEAAERDKQRRLNKEAAKKRKESRKGKNTLYREYSAEEIAAMNPGKRRRLEDLGIIAKRK